MILILGAAGALGSALLTVLGPDKALAAVRRSDHVDSRFKTVLLEDGIIAANFNWCEITAVINAAGKTVGSEGELRKANVELPVAVAKQAFANGVSRFVQVSSFSVFGDVDIINNNTPTLPTNAYGRSKLLAENRLNEISCGRFNVFSIRLPFMFNEFNPGILSKLINFLRTFHFIPISHDGAVRSILSYENAALILLEVAEGRINQSGCASSDQYFRLDDFVDLIREEYGSRIWTINLPQPFDRALHFLAPNLHRRLFRSSILQPEANVARNLVGLQHLEISLRSVVRAMNNAL